MIYLHCLAQLVHSSLSLLVNVHSCLPLLSVPGWCQCDIHPHCPPSLTQGCLQVHPLISEKMSAFCCSQDAINHSELSHWHPFNPIVLLKINTHINCASCWHSSIQCIHQSGFGKLLTTSIQLPMDHTAVPKMSRYTGVLWLNYQLLEFYGVVLALVKTV